MGLRTTLLKFSLPLLALLYGACSTIGNTPSSSVPKNNSPETKVERMLPYFPKNGYKRVDENTWFINNSGIPYLSELDSLDGQVDGRILTPLIWRDAIAYANGEFIAITSTRENNFETPIVIRIDAYGEPRTVFFDKDFRQRFNQVSLDAEDYGVDGPEEEIALIMRYSDKKSILVIDAKSIRPVFWYEADDISLANLGNSKIIIGTSQDKGAPIIEAHKWNGEKYIKTEVPAELVIRTEKVRQTKIVFADGICSTDPKDTFKEIAEWLAQDMGYTYSDLSYYNYTENGNSGTPYDESETLKSIDDRDGSAENFRNFLRRMHIEEPDTKFDVIAHSLGGVIALYALNQHPELQNIVRSVVTINSPLRGVDFVKSNVSRLFPCISSYEIKHKIPPPVLEDIKEESPTILSIEGTDYSIFSSKGVYITTIANSNDIVVSSSRYKSGKVGVLDTTFWNIYSFGLDPPIGIVVRYPSLVNPLAYAHSGSLRIRSLEEFGKTEEANTMKDSLRNVIKREQ